MVSFWSQDYTYLYEPTTMYKIIWLHFYYHEKSPTTCHMVLLTITEVWKTGNKKWHRFKELREIRVWLVSKARFFSEKYSRLTNTQTLPFNIKENIVKITFLSDNEKKLQKDNKENSLNLISGIRFLFSLDNL